MLPEARRHGWSPPVHRGLHRRYKRSTLRLPRAIRPADARRRSGPEPAGVPRRLAGDDEQSRAPYRRADGPGGLPQSRSEFLVGLLDREQAATGSHDLSFESDEFAFRHLVAVYDKDFQMPSPGTTGPDDRVLLPIFLEVDGDLDVRGLSVSSAPLAAHDVRVRYSVTRPAVANVFHASAQGLSPEARKRLSEHELVAYDRVYRRLAARFIFGGKPNIRAIVCGPSVLGRPPARLLPGGAVVPEGEGGPVAGGAPRRYLPPVRGRLLPPVLLREAAGRVRTAGREKARTVRRRDRPPFRRRPPD